VSSSSYSTAHHSLSILSSQSSTASVFSYWTITVAPDGIVPGSQLTLKVKVKTDNLSGDGVFVALRADAGTTQVAFKTTQDAVEIKGTQDFVEYSVAIPTFPDKVTDIRIYFILSGNSIGTAYFDDVSLVNNF
jgi:hypothetical protein